MPPADAGDADVYPPPSHPLFSRIRLILKQFVNVKRLLLRSLLFSLLERMSSCIVLSCMSVLRENTRHSWILYMPCFALLLFSWVLRSLNRMQVLLKENRFLSSCLYTTPSLQAQPGITHTCMTRTFSFESSLYPTRPACIWTRRWIYSIRVIEHSSLRLNRQLESKKIQRIYLHMLSPLYSFYDDQHYPSLDSTREERKWANYWYRYYICLYSLWLNTM